MVDHKEDNERKLAENKSNEWIVTIKEMLVKVRRPSELSIYKVPNRLVKLKEDAYTPRIVSIGPFHHCNKELQAFEERKMRYMLFLFSRNFEFAERTLDECADRLLTLEQYARGCYLEHLHFDKHELVKILLVDGCFILELFLRYSDENHVDIFADPISHDAWTATLQRDLALLENQIPFFVLQTLFDIIKRSLDLTKTLTEYALLFFRSALGVSNEAIGRIPSDLTGYHLLHILHKFYFLLSDYYPNGLQKSEFKYCATQLLKAGIKFQAIAEENFLDIKFDDGVVKMPPLRIHEDTESIFRNLIAFEQCRIDISDCMASYASLMRSLLRSPQDVELFHEKRIIINDLSGGGGGGGVTTFFESLCNEVALKNFHFSELCKEVDGYYNGRRSKWNCRRLFLILEGNWRVLRVTAKDKWDKYMHVLHVRYFSNPWSIIAFIAAVVALIFTAMQTYFAYRTYYHQ